MSSPFDRLTVDERKLITPAPPPERATVMTAVLTDARFSDPDWIFERKLDGVRCLAIRTADSVRMLSRNDLSQNARYPEIAEALALEACPEFAVDGEIVAFQGSQTSFALLAQRHQRPVPVFFYVFDVVWLAGYDVRALPLRARKSLLRTALAWRDGIRLTPHRNGSGEELFREACRKGWEGVIAKRADSRYTAARSRDWLKFKCAQGQEFVIGGYTAPRGSRVELGALLVGYFDGTRLHYAGKVGTGFDERMLRELGGRLRTLATSACPFDDPASIRERQVSWVRPELVAEVGFSEWTRHGRLRHPRFLGLRDDKAARQVMRERPS